MLAEGVGELDEEFAEAVPLVLREGKDAGHVVVLGGFFFFREVANEVTTGGVALAL